MTAMCVWFATLMGGASYWIARDGSFTRRQRAG
jgi:hypothetical protein